MVRIVGALIRAVLMVIIITAPSFLLPNVTNVTRETSAIIGAIVGAFTFFEYGGANPGFVDFRFAPPFNRFRIAIITAQVVALSLICRAAITGEPFFAEMADKAVEYVQFPYNPVDFALAKVSLTQDLGSGHLLRQVFSASFVIAAGLALGFSALLWLARWPAGRSTFNIWANIPTFAPADIDKTEQRLKRDGLLNMILGASLIYVIPFSFPILIEMVGLEILKDQHMLVWFAALWAFLPALLFVRGASILKIGTILGKAVKSR